MMKQAGYNGASKRESFYKIKKHLGILNRQIGFPKELKRIQSIKDTSLQAILKAYLMVKKQDFSQEDQLVFSRQESYRNSLRVDMTPISYSVFGSEKEVTVSQICERSPSPKIWAQFLYTLCKQLGSRSILEIGTNLGISGGYILEALEDQASKPGSFLSMEGLPQLCELAQKHFSLISSKFEVIEGLYSKSIPELLARDLSFDLFFIDGNHQKGPTISYFHSFKQKARYPTVFIFDDINHSRSMKEAWLVIKSDGAVSYSIDLFKMGIVVLNGNTPNQRHDFKLFLAY
ncbi:MAG: class I SAM-dependent methyltransferase [Bacteroidota bacterium]